MEETQQALNYDRVIHELEINSPKTVSLLRRADPYNLDSNFLFFYSSPFVCLHKPESLENNQCERARQYLLQGSSCREKNIYET